MIRCLLCSGTKLALLTNELRNGEKWPVYYCSNCDLGFLAPQKLNAKKYYDREYRKTHSNNLTVPNSKPNGIFNTEKHFQKDRLKIIQKFFNQKKTFLEIGCSAGQFISQVKNRFRQCEGVELDTNCAKYVQKKIGIKTQTNELKDCDFKNKKFDYIAAFQTLEHVSDPYQFLVDTRKILNNGGKLFIEVPNLNDALLSMWPVDAYRKFYFHKAHTFYFSPKSLKKLFSKAGFKVEKIYFLQDYNLFNHFFWYLNNGPQSNSSFGLSTPHINFSSFSSRASQKINQLILTTDKDYKKILSEYQITSNIFVIASKTSK